MSLYKTMSENKPEFNVVLAGTGVHIKALLPNFKWKAAREFFKAALPNWRFRFHGRYENEVNCRADWVFTTTSKPNPNAVLLDGPREAYERTLIEALQRADPDVNHITFEWYTKRVYVVEGVEA